MKALPVALGLSSMRRPGRKKPSQNGANCVTKVSVALWRLRVRGGQGTAEEQERWRGRVKREGNEGD